MFSPDMQRGTTGGEDGQPFTGREQFRDEGGGGSDLLEVIEHQQQALAGQIRDERGTEGLRPAFRQSERLGDRGEDKRGVADGGEGHKEDAIGERWQGGRRGIECETGLADAPDPRDRDEPYVGSHRSATMAARSLSRPMRGVSAFGIAPGTLPRRRSRAAAPVTAPARRIRVGAAHRLADRARLRAGATSRAEARLRTPRSRSLIVRALTVDRTVNSSWVNPAATRNWRRRSPNGTFTGRSRVVSWRLAAMGIGRRSVIENPFTGARRARCAPPCSGTVFHALQLFARHSWRHCSGYSGRGTLHGSDVLIYCACGMMAVMAARYPSLGERERKEGVQWQNKRMARDGTSCSPTSHGRRCGIFAIGWRWCCCRSARTSSTGRTWRSAWTSSGRRSSAAGRARWPTRACSSRRGRRGASRSIT